MTVRVEYEANLLARRLVRRQPGTKAAAPSSPRSHRKSAGLRSRKAISSTSSPHPFKAGSTPTSSGASRWRGRSTLPAGSSSRSRARSSTLERGELDRLASHVCKAGKSDSGGLSIVFTSALRAGGIPARVSSGRWARNSEPGENAADEPHVKASFFATGVGWVPVDLGSAMVLDKSSEGLEFFGTDNADFLIMHFDTDLEFDTVFFGRKTVESVQNPVFWVSGSGSFDDFKLLVVSKIQTEPLNLSRPFPKPISRRPEPIESSQENTKSH